MGKTQDLGLEQEGGETRRWKCMQYPKRVNEIVTKGQDKRVKSLYAN
jgi:hypothetical protein